MSRSRALPSGTVTFLFTDIEGSTKLLHELGAEAYSDAVAEHRRILRAAFARHGGVEVDTQGDAFFVAFPSAPGALQAAQEALDGLAAGGIQVRIGIHTGTPHLSDEGYVGADVHKGARIAAAGHGGQVLLSKETKELVENEVSDLGEHRLKDFAEPVWIFQLGAQRFPPIRTISNTNLPRPASSFVGREREVAEIGSLLRNGARLVTLTGPGGSGKTRLSIEAATQLVPEFKSGVFWVALAALQDAALVADSITQTLGAQDGLVEHIGEREMLLLLDNLEQVIGAAPELAALVEACPNLRVMVTSRELLRVRGEVEYPVPPLGDAEAVELFCARSRLDPDETIAELCRRLDDLPLAVELAAARTSVLTPAQILERLSQRLDLLRGGRDADARQQTLRSTIEWSHDLLDEAEKRLFAQLAVFAGGCTLDAAATVADAEIDLLESLIDKSLIRHTGDRFWMLETIREFAFERLEASGDVGALRRRHAEHFLAFAEEAEPSLMDGDEVTADRLEREIDNFRAALDHLESAGETQTALRLAGTLAELWDQRAHDVEGVRRLESLLRADNRPTAARAKALNGALLLGNVVAALTPGMRWGEEALAIHRRLGDRRGEAISLWGMGYLLIERGDLTQAEQFLAESVQIFREVGPPGYLRWAIRTLAFAYDRLGDIERSRLLHEENLARAREANDRGLEATMLGTLAQFAFDDGRSAEATSLVRESLMVSRGIGNPALKAQDLSRAAQILAASGRAVPAAQVLGHAEREIDDIGGRAPWVERMNEATLADIRRQLDGPSFDDAWGRGRGLTSDHAFALALEALGSESSSQAGAES